MRSLAVSGEPSAPKLEGQMGEDGNSIKVNLIKQDDGGSPIRHYLVRYRAVSGLHPCLCPCSPTPSCQGNSMQRPSRQEWAGAGQSHSVSCLQLGGPGQGLASRGGPTALRPCPHPGPSKVCGTAVVMNSDRGRASTTFPDYFIPRTFCCFSVALLLPVLFACDALIRGDRCL